MLNVISICIIPIMIIIIIVYGIIEKKDVFALFTEGAIDGLKMVYKIFPHMLGIMIAIGLLRETGAINIVLYPLKPILEFLKVPADIIPLFILRPISRWSFNVNCNGYF